MSWVHSFPAAGGPWELVSRLAAARNVLTDRLVADLQRAGAQPRRISGAWMVKAANAEQAFRVLDAAPVAVVQPTATLSIAPASAMPSDIASRLDAQERELQELHARIAELMKGRSRD